MSFWQTIIETNTFNFAILILIFAVLYKKLNVSKIIEDIKLTVIKRLEDAKSKKTEAELKLQNAEKSIKNVNTEIENILSNAEKQASGLSAGIKDSAETKVRNIEENVTKTINAEEKYIANKAISNTINKSVILAEKHIADLLKNQPDLHYKFIEEFLKEI